MAKNIKKTTPHRRNRVRYIDGFVLSVPKKKIAKYCNMSKKVAKILQEYGVLEYRECVGEDVQDGMGMPFPKLVKPKRGEVIVFSWIGYKSKTQRNSINKKIIEDPRISKICNVKDMPFDCKRMAYGGFKVFVDLG